MKKAAAAVFILALSVLPARAEDFAAGLIIGYAVLRGDAGNVSDDGICFGAYGDYFIDPSVAIEGTIIYSRHDDVIGDKESHTIDVLYFLLGPKFLFPRPKMTPYISFGPSLYSLDYKFNPGNGTGIAKHDDDTEAGLFSSAGIVLPLGERLSLNFNLSYHYVFNTDVLDGDIITSTIAFEF